MTSEVEKYLQARFEFEEVRILIDLLADDIILVGNALKRDPSRFSFSETGIELPADAAVGQKYPASTWASPSVIQEQLKRYHEIRVALRRSWATIPANLKSGLQPPPPGVMPPQGFQRKDE